MRPNPPGVGSSSAGATHDSAPTPVPSLMETAVVRCERSVVVAVRGEIDPSAAGLLAGHLAAAIAEAPRVIVDLRDVTFMDSSGLSVLVDAFHHSGQNSEALVVRSPSEFITRLFTLTGLDQYLTIEPAPRPGDGSC